MGSATASAPNKNNGARKFIRAAARMSWPAHLFRDDSTGPVPGAGMLREPAGWKSAPRGDLDQDRKSTRLNSSHSQISYAVFCLKKKTKEHIQQPVWQPGLLEDPGQHDATAHVRTRVRLEHHLITVGQCGVYPAYRQDMSEVELS